jgi:hypothetical protein
LETTSERKRSRGEPGSSPLRAKARSVRACLKTPFCEKIAQFGGLSLASARKAPFLPCSPFQAGTGGEIRQVAVKSALGIDLKLTVALQASIFDHGRARRSPRQSSRAKHPQQRVRAELKKVGPRPSPNICAILRRLIARVAMTTRDFAASDLRAKKDGRHYERRQAARQARLHRLSKSIRRATCMRRFY